MIGRKTQRIKMVQKCLHILYSSDNTTMSNEELNDWIEANQNL